MPGPEARSLRRRVEEGKLLPDPVRFNQISLPLPPRAED